MNICKTCVSRFGCHPSFETDGTDTCSFYEADKKALPTQVDWEQRRYEIAKDVAASLAQRSGSMYDSIVNSAIKIADKLIERLKEK